MVNQFRQLYVVKSIDDNDTYIVNKRVTSDNFADLAGNGSTTGNLYVKTAKFVLVPSDTTDPYSSGTNYYTKNSANKMIKDTAVTNTTYKDGSHYVLDDSSASGGYVRLASTDVYVSNTTYYTKETALPNEEGEINFKVSSADTVNKKIYFTYVGKGKDKNGNASISRSPLIDPKNIVSIKAVNPAFLNKNKLIQTTTVGFVVDNDTLPNQVVLGINFTNFANGDSSIYPFTVSANKGSDLAGTVANIVSAINDGKIVDLSGNQLVTASAGASNTLVITANACGSYELGMQDVYYPKFTITEKMDDNILTPQETTFAVDTVSANGDVAAEMELLFMGERMQSGLPFNYPFNVNSKTMVDPTAAYSCLDIHYYIDNDKDFSQRSHGTITLLVKESAMNSVTLMNNMLGGVSGTPAGSSANEGTLNKALATAGYSNLVLANISA